jgi:nitrite reductase/ring-hydroxylating ferredoxin subunit
MSVSPPLCAYDDLPMDGALECRVGDAVWPLRVIVVRRGESIYAYQNRCPHAGHPLNMRPHEFLDAEHRHLMCRSHGAMFAIETGHCIAGPCVGTNLRTIPVVLDDGQIRLASGAIPADLDVSTRS